MVAHVVSVNVGMPREVESRGQIVRTGIFKSPVPGRVAVHPLNLDGDAQADLTVHGGRDKAVYAYPSEHYPAWRQELPELEFPWGAFGENLTIAGLHETTMRIGDRLRIGTEMFRVTQPRMPCFKLGVRFDRPDMIKHFQHSGRSGFYLAVEETGELGAGDAIEHYPTATASLSIAAITQLYIAHEPEQEMLRLASELADLPEGWRAHFRKRLDVADPTQP
jgi:MOSC domain-containing protein YiiM